LITTVEKRYFWPVTAGMVARQGEEFRYFKIFCAAGNIYIYIYIDKPVYNDIGLYGTSPTQSDILWYQLILTLNHNIIFLGFNDIRL
jgi:hypothetical protein